jgi:hypothetical protein
MDDPMPARQFERVRELLRDQERLCVASIEVSEQWRTQGGKKVILKIRLPSRAATLDAFPAVRGRSFARVRAEL